MPVGQEADQEKVAGLLAQDLERIASQRDDTPAFCVTVRSDHGDTREVTVRDPSQEIHTAIVTAFGWDGNGAIYVEFGDQVVAEGESFEEHGIEDGARLGVSLPENRKATFQEVAEEIVRLNDGVSIEELIQYPAVPGLGPHPDDPSRLNGDLDWESKGISELPGIISDLTIEGFFDLSKNRLTSLPEGFGSLTVKKALYLNNNQLSSLPEDFGSLSIGGELWLYNNELSSLPESFGSLPTRQQIKLFNNPIARSLRPNPFPRLKLWV